MSRPDTPHILALLIVAVILGGCSNSGSNANTGVANAASETANGNRSVEPGMEGAKDNTDELATLIKMPFVPEDLVWKEYIAAGSGGSQARRLLAVFQFSPADSNKIVENAGKIRAGAPIVLSSEKWFPKELVTQNEMSGEDGIQATSYAADEFLQPPYSQGTISRVDNTDFFVLEAFAK